MRASGFGMRDTGAGATGEFRYPTLSRFPNPVFRIPEFKA